MMGCHELFAMDTKGQTLYKTMIEGKGLKNSEALISLQDESRASEEAPMGLPPWV